LGRDRAFDDLYRQYFVAFSRAQDVLILAGLNVSGPQGRISNVAAGYARDLSPRLAHHAAIHYI
jgi:DNA helicase-2/ATP-dependent DNA helicase PcrA